MNDHPVAQAIGSVLILVFAALLAAIGFMRCHERTREALFAAAGYMAVAVVIRMFALVNLVEHDTARALNGLLVVPFAAALIVPYLARVLSRHE